LHLFVQLHIAVLTFHASIQELIEIDESTITLDAHLEKLLFEIAIIIMLLTESKRLLFITHCLSKFSEEFGKVVFLNLSASISLLSEFLPDIHKLCEILHKVVDSVVWSQIVLIELLDDNQNEEVKHHMLANQNDYHEQVGRERVTTINSFDTSIYIGFYAIKHNEIPIFTG
jgi:hypothetical protein